jgi:eukaryotic-like serine/threonine-protein kinase
VMPQSRVQETLLFMGRQPNERLTNDVARDVCQRIGSKAMLSGSIASLGSQYIVMLNALNCQTGDSLAQEQAEAAGKEQVLTALGSAASKLRERLGESLASVQKYDVPIDKVTTSSLEALKAFALGDAEFDQGNEIGSLTFYKRALELDPNFAWVYARMGTIYANASENEKAIEATRKAYELRDRVSEREKLYITEHYYQTVTGEEDKEMETLELYGRTFPTDTTPPNNLAVGYEMRGDFDKAIDPARRATQLDPNYSGAMANLQYAYLGSGHPDEALETLQQSISRFPNSVGAHLFAYYTYLMLAKTADAERELQWLKGKPLEHRALNWQAQTLQEQGKFKQSEEIRQRALELEKNAGLTESAEGDLGWLALAQTDAELCDRALKNANELAAKPERAATTFASMVFASCGQAQKAEAGAAKLNKDYPLDSFLQKSEIPQIRARIELQRGDGTKALAILHPAEAFQLGFIESGTPVYLRGLAYLQAKQGAEAVAEFQKLLDHRPGLGPGVWQALAKLGQGRGYTLAGDAAKSRTAYQDFFTMWKDADPDLPLLKAAKSEYEKSQN